MRKALAFVYGVMSYLFFLAAFLYAIGFVGNLAVPKSIDTGSRGPLWQAVLVDVLLLGLFAIQHSVMARPAFKRWWTKIVPRSIERSTYVLFASSVLALLMWQWRPLPTVVWNVEPEAGRTVLWGLFGLGWGIVLVATFMISHVHLFGLQQVTEYFQGKEISAPKFQTPGFYRYLRHPIMLGFFIAFWTTPQMTVGHLLFAVATTGYILIALQLEEHDLLQHFGERYEKYRERVPMFIPRLSSPTPPEERTKPSVQP